MDLISDKSSSLGIKLDLISAGILYTLIIVMAVVILLKKNLSLKEKFNTIAFPISLIVVGLMISITLRLNNN
jgi:hypothetical protein